MNYIKILVLCTLASMLLLGACKEDLFEEEIVDCPMVESTDPEDLATDIPTNQIINVVFNKEMDPATVNTNSLIVEEVSGTVSYSGVTATFTPNSPLDHNTIYTARVKTTARDLYGLALEEEYIWTFTTESTVDLGSVDRFGIISGTGVSNSAGFSEINNLDIGVYPADRSSIIGFLLVDGGAGILNNGNFYAANDPAPVPAMLSQAKDDLNFAYITAEGADYPAAVTVSGDLGGHTLAPGIYKSNSTLYIQNGDLTLDGQGNPNAEWIFQVASTLTTFGGAPYPSPVGGNVILKGGAHAKNVTWQVGSSATIGDYTSFNGNILALTSITMNSFSKTNGRMLSRDGSVTLTSTNTINKP